MGEPVERAKIWKRVTAPILDFVSVFAVVGYVIARIVGQTTDDGFKLSGAPAFVLLAIIVLYFFVLRRYAGGTLWDRVFRIRRPQPSD